MPTTPVRIGPPQVFLSVDNNVVLPAIGHITPTVTAVTTLDYLLNDVNQPLLTTDSYNVLFGLMGTDPINNGYTVGATTLPLASPVTISTKGQGLYAHIANSAWPVGFDSTIAVAVFLQINSAQYQLADFAFMDTSYDFNHIILGKPLRVSPKWATNILTGTSQSATNSPTTGSAVVIDLAVTSGYSVGQQVLVVGGSNAEICVIGSIASGVSITVNTLVHSYTDPVIYNLNVPSDVILGSRGGQAVTGICGPLGVSYLEITPTTGVFNFKRPVTNVQVSPNNAPDFQVATGRGVGISFESLVNDIKTFVQASAGVYAKFVGDNASNITIGLLSLNTAQAILRGNRSVQVFLPPDAAGNQEIRLLLGMLTFNQIELDEAWSKSATTPVRFQFDPASLDRLITNQHTEVQYLRGN
jgi:hypothetical protein